MGTLGFVFCFFVFLIQRDVAKPAALVLLLVGCLGTTTFSTEEGLPPGD